MIMGLGAAAAAACAVLGARVGVAHAEGAGVVVVPASRAASPANDVARAVASAASADADALVKARRARAAGAVPAEELASFAQVARLEAEGWRAYQVAVDAEFAASRLASARSQAERLLALPGGVEVYAEVSLRLGLVLAHLGRKEEAAEALRLARALDPERLVTTAEFSPDHVATFDAAIAAKPPSVSVTLTATGRAMLVVDGVDVGRAPQTVALAHGQHVVVAHARGRVSRGIAVSVGASTSDLEVTLEHAPAGDALDRDEALAAGAGEDEATTAVADTLLYAELDELFVVASVFRGGGPALLGQRCVLARPPCTAIVEIGHVDGGLEAAARTLVERLRGASPRYGVMLPRDPRVASGERGNGKSDGCRWCRSPWVLGGGGVVAAALITGTVYALTRDDPSPVVTLDPGDFTD
jgi:tetratricopeptide (TPR) repeat protein